MSERVVDDFERTESEKPVAGRAFIQWKGTRVCMDLTCPSCGRRGHVDGDFAYFVKCSTCGAVFEMNAFVSFHEPSKADADAVESDDCNTREF
jgi:transcription elongation factor Elf1